MKYLEFGSMFYLQIRACLPHVIIQSTTAIFKLKNNLFIFHICQSEIAP